MHKNSDTSITSVLKDVVSETGTRTLILLGIAASILTIVTALAWNIAATAIVVLICAMLGMGIVLYKLGQNFVKLREDFVVKVSLLDELEADYDKEEYEKVLKFAPLSRPLRVTGRLEMCVQLGRLLEKAARRANKPIPRAQVLMDNLGWVLFRMDRDSTANINDARTNILAGIGIAKTQQDYYLVQRGLRHLSGIELRSGSLDRANEYFEEAKTYAQKIGNNNAGKKKEALAGLLVNEALLEVKRRKFESAHEKLKASQQEYYRLAGDENRDRAANIDHLIGDVLYDLGSQQPTSIEEAIDAYIEGARSSRRESRTDGNFRCILGLARIHESRDIREALSYYRQALEAAESMQLRVEISEIRGKIAILNRLR